VVSRALFAERLTNANRPAVSVTLTCPLHMTVMPAGDTPARSAIGTI